MDNWNSLFNSEQQRMGKNDFLSNRVSHVQKIKEGFTATVWDGRDIRVTICTEKGVIGSMFCGCADAIRGVHCHHMAAVIMAVEAEGYDLKAPAGKDPGAGNTHTGKGAGGAAGRDKTQPVKPGKGSDADTFSEDAKSQQRLEALPDLEKMRREDLENRLSVSPQQDAALESIEQYRYFQYEDYLKGLNISAKTMKEARQIVNQGRYEYFQIGTGYLRSPVSYPGDGEEISVDDLVGSASVLIDGTSKVSVLFGRHKLINASCDNWNCYRIHLRSSGSYLREGICAHEAALILLIQDYLKENNIGDSTDQAGLAFMRGMAAASGDRILPEGENAPGRASSLSIIPYVIMDEEGQMSASFRVSSGKAYKIKDLNDFVGNMERGAEQTFGTKTVMQLGEEYLDEGGKGWFDFIRDAVEGERQRAARLNSASSQYGYYYSDRKTYDYQISDSIPLYGALIDRFYRLCGSSAVEFQIPVQWQSRRRKAMLTTLDEPLKLSLTLSGETEKRGGALSGIVLTGSIPDLVYGQDGAYFVQEPHLVHIDADQVRRMRPLLDSAREGSVHLRIGRKRMQEFYRNMLPQLRQIADVKEENAALVERYLPPAVNLVCYLDVDEGDLIAHPEAIYGTRVHEVTDLLMHIFEDQGRELPPGVELPVIAPYRDVRKEEELLNLLGDYMTGYDGSLNVLYSSKDDERVFDFLDTGLERLLKICEVHTTDRFRRLGIRKNVSLRVGVSIENGLMDLTVTGTDLSAEELLDLLYKYRHKQKFVRLRNGDFLKIDQNETVQQLAEMLDTLRITPKEFVKGKMHLPAYRALYVDRMLEKAQDASVDRDKHFKGLIKGFKTVDDSDFEIPKSLNEQLRNYQKAGYRWLRTLDTFGFGGILADEMGLGKTLQVITVLLAVKEERDAQGGPGSKTVMENGELVQEEDGAPTRSIVVCPASLVYNWEAEFHRFAPDLKVETITGTSAARREKIALSTDADVLVTSYDLLKRDIDAYEGILFRFAVIDEAQFIKNHTTAAARSVKLLRAQTRYALTGTPIENRLSELWSIFDFLMPGFLFEYSVFKNNYEQQIVKYEDEAVSERLSRMVSPFILRRLKKDVLRDLPDKLEEVRYAGMEGEQQKLYDAQVVRMKQKLASQSEEEFSKSKLAVLSELTRIRQICCDPSLCFEGYRGPSAKREACLDLIRQAIEEGHRMLIFSQFVTMLNLLEEDLKDEGISYYMITGETHKKHRLELVNAFNEGDVPVFLISLKAGGTGLNLTGADIVIHYDPWWNLAAQNQATDRAHRIGQTKIVTVYKLIMKGTIEEKILELQEAKQMLADNILGSEGVSSSSISREDLLAMLEG